MSTRSTIKWSDGENGEPGFHLYDDLADTFRDLPEGHEHPVYLAVHGVPAQMETTNGGASVTVVLPRAMARALGLLPAVPRRQTPIAYVANIADGERLMLTDENDIGIALYTAVQLDDAVNG
jgi:hypothetical protein